MDDCIFCKIIRKEIPKDLGYESENLVAFADINPSADIHLLIVPKEHIAGVSDLDETCGSLLTEVYKVANKLVNDNNLTDKAYRVVVNGGKAQHVPHLHFHLLGGQLKKLV
ncbi:HIT domain-containing protein [Candidatus Daviesbacteria bacterium]|nr:HIT domain-containing protein [Candidatus Daviesbacteria bacterium]